MFGGNCATIKWNSTDETPIPLVCQTVLHWKALCQNETALRAPASASASFNKRGLMTCACVILDGLWPLLVCFPAFQHLFDLLYIWTRRTNLGVRFSRNLSQIHCPEPVWFGENPLICHSVHLLESNQSHCLPAACLFQALVSKFIHTLFASFPIWEWFPGYWRGKGSLSTHLSFVFRGKNWHAIYFSDKWPN